MKVGLRVTQLGLVLFEDGRRRNLL